MIQTLNADVPKHMRYITTVFIALVSAAIIGTAAAASDAAQSDLAPLFLPGTWLNGQATPSSLKGKVVLVDVFTFNCINCKHVVPNLRSLRSKQNPAAFEIVGVHAPETPYERDQANVVENLSAQGITWPVRIDNDFTVWSAYGIQAWPTQLIFDRHGRLRKKILGEGQDDSVNSTIQTLLQER